ncbi:hypothetical protein [Thermosulfurimonas dismutans]|uniref:Cell division protein FtsL n=1 Tax=Thermosulfurimonas dismutans TaxID=999894 RepID=A0A179D3T1_9BACT|nr:hypothetical protein [Thermosulfurimonas dismutans]OAQ20132.1 hypothetical protein TDIS_1758 [Thermosulfurimonas dismutans]
MRALTLGYTYQPRKNTSRASTKASGLSLRLSLIFKLVLLLLLVLPWGFAAYRFHQLRGVESEIKRERALKTKLLSEWERLTAEEVIRAKVAPLGLFKPTEKEIIRLP